MHLPSLFVLVVYVAAYVLLLFAAICVACGLYYLVELAEEHTVLTKKLIRLAILGELALRFLLWAYERLWFFPNFVGAVAQISYLLLLRSFPYIEPTSGSFIVSCILFVAENIVWYRSFHGDPEFFYKYRVSPFFSLASFFFLVVWFVPLGFFVSLTVNDAVLPSSMPNGQARYSNLPNGQPYATLDSKKDRKSQNILVVGVRNLITTVKNSLGVGRSAQDPFSSSGMSGFR